MLGEAEPAAEQEHPYIRLDRCLAAHLATVREAFEDATQRVLSRYLNYV